MTDAGIPMGEVLKPCPFCGGRAIDVGDHRASKIMCSNNDCEAEARPWYAYDKGGLAKAIAAWNTRAFAGTPPPAAAGDRALAREAYARIIDPDAWRRHEWAKANSSVPHSMGIPESLAKAGAILALRTPEPNSGGEDTARLDFLASNSYDLQCFDVPTGGGDADIGWRVVGHWQTEPQERTIAEAFNDDLRAAIDAARAEDAS